MAEFCLLVFVLILALPNLFISGVFSSATFTMLNKCQHTVWPGIQSNAGIAQLSVTGFALHKGESKTIKAPSSWAGRFWARTLCSEDSAGKFTCVICKPSSYSELFKNACPRTCSYAYDDKTSTFTCAGADYLITFCPSPSTSYAVNFNEGRGRQGHQFSAPLHAQSVTGKKHTPQTTRVARRLLGGYEEDFRPTAPSSSPGVRHSSATPIDYGGEEEP